METTQLNWEDMTPNHSVVKIAKFGSGYVSFDPTTMMWHGAIIAPPHFYMERVFLGAECTFAVRQEAKDAVVAALMARLFEIASKQSK